MMMLMRIAAAVFVVLAIAGIVALRNYLSETATESYVRRSASLIGEWMIGLESGPAAAAHWVGADSLSDGNYQFYDYLRFDEDATYERRTLLFRDDLCFALLDAGDWDPDRDSEREYIQLYPHTTGFGCYRIEAGQELHLMKRVSEIALTYVAANKPWAVDPVDDPDVATLESIALNRAAYTIEMASMNNRVLELDLNEGTERKRRFRAYERVSD